MTIGLLIGTEELQQYFYKNCPDILIDNDIQFLMPDELYRAEVLVTTADYLKEMPDDPYRPIVLVSDNEDNLFLDERIIAVVPFPTDTDGFELLGFVLLNIKSNYKYYKRFLESGSV